MNDREFEAEEFERLLGLPEGDPERVRAERSSRFVAWKHMLETFEKPPDELLTPRERAQAEADLAERVRRAVARLGTAEPSRQRPPSTTGSWLDRWMEGRRSAVLRPALAMAAVVVVAAAGWWSIDRLNERSAVRSADDSSAMALRAIPSRQEVELRWLAVPGAKMYRLVFSAPDLRDRARIDSLHVTRFTLRATDLPAGLARGELTLVEVIALRENDAITSKPVSIRVP
jgi:hypothetical protein